VLIPQENVKDLAEIPDNIKNRLEIHPVRWIEQVLDMALERKPEPLPEQEEVREIPAQVEEKPAALITKH
jgi:ATP-dependent Lon protease